MSRYVRNRIEGGYYFFSDIILAVPTWRENVSALRRYGHVGSQRPHFHNEKAAYAYVEERIGPKGPICPQHCAKRHLHRYLAEFDFRYSERVALGVNDVARTDKMLIGVVGKRLTYRPAHGLA